MMLRKHQKDFEFIIDDIIDSNLIDEINVVATPGAGKSSLPIQATRLIQEGLVDAIGWIVPRSALQNQGERGFMDVFFRDMFPHNNLIRSSTNDINPRRGTDGFVTTYQAISADKMKTVLHEVKNKRYILFLDEFHHLEDGGVWHEAIDDIVQAATILVKMTGTLGRGDKKEIAYIDYKNRLPLFHEGGNSRLITYPRTTALREKAILPIKFHLHDGEFAWKDLRGSTRTVSSFKKTVTPQQQSDALFTALHSDFFDEILRECVNGWKEWKKSRPSSKLLVVTADYDGAKRANKILNYKLGIVAKIATSHEPANAVKYINEFKGPECDCLITIAMAYEGLDVPEISHISLLTNIRSREWIEQCLARGVRIDKKAGSYDSQMCHVFAPIDKRLKKVVDLVKKEQLSATDYFSKIKEDEEILPKEIEDEDLFPEMGEKRTIEPISSRITDRSEMILGQDHVSVENSIYNMPMLTVKEQEVRLRKEIHKHVNIFCRNNRYKPAKINSEIKDRFDKARDHMDMDELKKLSTFIIKYYPINGVVITHNEDVSRVRGRGKSVPKKIKTWTSASDILNKYNYNYGGMK